MTDGPKQPQTDAEWQDAVNAAEYCLRVDAARQFGLIEGGPAIDVERCLELRDAGAERGIVQNLFEE